MKHPRASKLTACIQMAALSASATACTYVAQNKEDERKRLEKYERKHGRPEWLDFLGFNAETWGQLQADDPAIARTGFDPELVDYFRGA